MYSETIPPLAITCWACQSTLEKTSCKKSSDLPRRGWWLWAGRLLSSQLRRKFRRWEVYGDQKARLWRVLDGMACTWLKVRDQGQLLGLALNLYRDCRHVALKVLRSECYGGKHDIFELQMLDAISKVSKYSSHPGRNHVLQLLSRFCHTGPHGNHVCFVTDVFGPHIGFHTAYSHRRMLPIKAVKDVLLQLLLGLDFLHRECGIIHTGMFYSQSHMYSRC